MIRARLSALAVVPALLAVLAAVPGTARAQLGIAAGVTVPSGDFGDAAKNGFVLNPFLEFGLPGPLAIRASVLWTRSDLDNGFVADLPTPPSNENVSGDVNLVGASADLKLVIPIPVVTPYVIGGIGVYRQSVKQDVSGVANEVADIDEDNTEMGYNIGVGVQIPLVVVRLFAEARYYSVQSSPTQNFVPITIGVRF